MRIQCNGCEVTEVKVLCCADEAAPCWECDEKVHAANKLAIKHQRIPLSHSSSQMPKCDICQDRALLCRKCHVAIHTANSYVSKHQSLGLGSIKPCVSATMNQSDSIAKASETESSQSISRRDARIRPTCESTGMLQRQIGGVGTVPAGEVSSTAVNIPEWHLDDYLAMADFSHNYTIMDDAFFSKWVFSRR